MKRRLSSRELALLYILFVLVLISGYYILFYTPMTEEKTALETQIVQTQELILQEQVRVAQKESMEQELERIFAENDNPVSIAPYDNLQPVMFELNSILGETEEYSLNFETVDTQQQIVRRSISLRYQSPDYDAARQVLQKLHDSDFRCMLDGLNISIGEGEQAAVSVSATIVFFEYQ